MCKYILPECMFVYHMHAQESQKTASDTLTLELGIVVRDCVGVGTQHKPLARASCALTIKLFPQPHSSHLI